MIEHKRIVVTGGAGFVGSSIIHALREQTDAQIIAFDNLRRRGSELNLERFKEIGVEFIHGDARLPSDWEALPDFDLLIDCAAEPSVLQGTTGSGWPLIENNLVTTAHCLEAARRNDAAFMLLSTSRIYPIQTLESLKWKEQETRYEWLDEQTVAGVSSAGVTEEFPLPGARSLYGATKLASEYLLQEYHYLHGMPVMVNRCGVLAGPWQMGKVDQGVVSLWVARHYFEKPLCYKGFGGTGKQVRDVLHIDDFSDLLLKQLKQKDLWNAKPYNVGGGREVSTSLLELTKLCQKITGHSIPLSKEEETSSVDLRIYLTDNERVTKDFDWKPQRSMPDIVESIYRWIDESPPSLQKILG
ncbi:MAG: NAD-dependent epimerase/dehydratase family protein [Gimesia sp.]